jgi:hypothetical protein
MIVKTFALNSVLRTIYAFIRLGLYNAFQEACDPGTVVLCTGMEEEEGAAEARQNTRSLNAGLSSSVPVVVKSLLGLHVTQISCGGQHVAVLTKSGRVYTWGKGGFGRLGMYNLNTIAVGLNDASFVMLLIILNGCPLTYLFRLGHGNTNAVSSPRLVETLKEEEVTGSYHFEIISPLTMSGFTRCLRLCLYCCCHSNWHAFHLGCR